jgi:UDP-3-O-acyl-N-acetylglucosamine deacetylase
MLKDDDFSGHWLIDQCGDLLEEKKEVRRKPRAYKSLHASEYVTIKRNGEALVRQMAISADTKEVQEKGS